MNETGKSDGTRLKRYDYYKGPERLDVLWTLSRTNLTMRCSLVTHRLGWELRLAAGASFSRSQVCRTESDVRTTSTAWEAEARAKGWT